MRGDKDDIDIDETLTYSITSESFNKPLRITNRSTSIYVFKVNIDLNRLKPTKRLLSPCRPLTILSSRIQSKRLL